MENEDFFATTNIDLDIFWQDVLDEISKQISVISYEVWIRDLKLEKLDNNILYLSTSTVSSKNAILKNHQQVIVDSAKKLYNRIEGIEIEIRENLTENEQPEEKSEPVTKERVYIKEDGSPAQKQQTDFNEKTKSYFNPKYTFDNFVIGTSNKFACATAKAVAENPGKTFNPLFIYGGSGLGKTHLLHAIGNYISESHPELNAIYVTTETFTNEFVSSLQTNTTAKFKETYSKADVLIIDDIQQIIKRTQTQEQFFNLFNELHNNGKQIVITSDKPPKELNPLEERLRSRLQWGILADIGVPDIETRIAILNKKAQIERYNVSHEVIEYIAEIATTNVREMEGYLASAVNYSNLIYKESIVTLESAKEALKNIAKENEETIDATKIIDIVCKFFNVKKEELLARKRTKTIAEARQIAMYLITEFMSLPLKAVGEIFGKDHSTVIFAKNKISDDMKKSKRLEIQINDLKQMIEGK